MHFARNVCVAEHTEGEVLQDWSKTHGLIGMLATILFEHRHPDLSVALKTGHRDLNSLNSYQYLCWETSFAQHRSIATSGCHLNESWIEYNNTKESQKRIIRDSIVTDQERPNGAYMVSADPTAEKTFFDFVSRSLFSHVEAVTRNNISVTTNPYKDPLRHGEDKEWFWVKSYSKCEHTREIDICFKDFQ